MPSLASRVLKIVGIVALIIMLVVVTYVAYVFTSSYRLQDNMVLQVQEAECAAGEGTAASPAIPDATSITPKENTQYSMTSYNVGFGAYSVDYSFFMDGGSESRARSPEAVNENIGGACEEVKQANPDIALFQEVDVDGTRSHNINEVNLINDALPEFGYRVFAQNYDSPYLFYPFLSPHGANKSGIYTMSKFPIESALRRQLPVEDGITSILDLDRCYSVSRIPVKEDAELIVYNVHLSAYTSDGKIAEEQLRMLFADMEKEREAGNWTIAGGDFNKDLLGNSGKIFGVSGEQHNWAQPLPEGIVPNGFAVIAPFNEQSPVATCRDTEKAYDPNTFVVTVDGFIVSSNVDVLSAEVIDTGFMHSDHNPVFMKFELEQAQASSE